MIPAEKGGRSQSVLHTDLDRSRSTKEEGFIVEQKYDGGTRRERVQVKFLTFFLLGLNKNIAFGSKVTVHFYFN